MKYTDLQSHFLLGDATILSKTDTRHGSKKRKREAMVKLEIIKQCKESCHLFQFFILSNNILQRFSKVYVAISFHLYISQ